MEERITQWTKEIKAMDIPELKDALDEIDYERKIHNRSLCQKVWTDEDRFMMSSMNAWAKIVWDELVKRKP